MFAPLLLLIACGVASPQVGDTDDEDTGRDDSGSPDSGDDSGEPDSGDSGDTDDSGETGDTGEDTGPVVYDCDAPPTFNLGDDTLDDARAYHGVSFDDDGHLIGWDARSAVMKSSYDGAREVFVPDMRGVEQIDRLADGDFVLSDTTQSRLLRVTPEGGSETLAANTGYAYGVTVGPDGNVWIADGGVHRVDVETGEITTLFSQMPRSTAHVVNFNLDSTVMYVGTIGRGDIFAVDLDADLDPVSEPALFATVGAGSGWHDGLGVDVCGNVYVADYYNSGLYRVSPDGSTVTEMVNANSTLYGHGLQWGSGVGGWREDALYQPQPYNGNKVREVVIGIPNGDSVRTWNGVKVPW